jgi:hypothetical protein
LSQLCHPTLPQPGSLSLDTKGEMALLIRSLDLMTTPLTNLRARGWHTNKQSPKTGWAYKGRISITIAAFSNMLLPKKELHSQGATDLLT